MTEREKIRYAKQFDRRANKIESKWRPVLRKALDREAKQFLTYYKARGGNLFTDLELDRHFGAEGVLLVIIAMHVHAGLVNANLWYKKLKSVKFGDPSGHNSEWINDVLKSLERDGLKQVKRIKETTKRRISIILSQSVLNGWGIEKTAEAITKHTRIHPERAKRIARTEIISASNLGSRIGAKKTGLRLTKEWVSKIDNRSRGARLRDKTNHIVMDGQVAEIDGFYQLKGKYGVEFAQYPNDPKLSASNRVNCRCTEVYEPVEDSVPAYVPETAVDHEQEAREAVTRMIEDLSGKDVRAYLDDNEVIYKEVTAVMKELGFDFGVLFE